MVIVIIIYSFQKNKTLILILKKRGLIWKNYMLIPLLCSHNSVGSTVRNNKWKNHCKHFLNCDGNVALELVKLLTYFKISTCYECFAVYRSKNFHWQQMYLKKASVKVLFMLLSFLVI